MAVPALESNARDPARPFMFSDYDLHVEEQPSLYSSPVCVATDNLRQRLLTNCVIGRHHGCPKVAATRWMRTNQNASEAPGSQTSTHFATEQ